MKKIKRYSTHAYGIEETANGEWCKYSVVKKLQAQIKELESDKHLNEIKAQGINEAVNKADNETYIGLVGQEFPPQSQYRAELLCYAELLKLRDNDD